MLLTLLQAKLGIKWDQSYKGIYGTVADFMRTHPEAFYQRTDGAFYRPDAPARQLAPVAAPIPPRPTSTAHVVPAGMHYCDKLSPLQLLTVMPPFSCTCGASLSSRNGAVI